MLQSSEVDWKEMRKKYEYFNNEYFNRVTKILKMGLNIGNTIQGINTFAVPSYGYQVLEWSMINWKILTNKKWMYCGNIICDTKTVTWIVKRSGGRGLLNTIDLYKTQIITYSQYLFCFVYFFVFWNINTVLTQKHTMSVT